MRGNPLVRFVAVIAIFALAGLPVWWVTRAESARVVSSDMAPAGPIQKGEGERAAVLFHISITCAHAPDVVRVEYLGKEVFVSNAPALRYAGEFSLPALPVEGGDFVVKAQWPQGTLATALRVVLETAGPESGKKEATFWAQGSLADVMTFVPPRKRG